MQAAVDSSHYRLTAAVVSSHRGDAHDRVRSDDSGNGHDDRSPVSPSFSYRQPALSRTASDATDTRVRREMTSAEEDAQGEPRTTTDAEEDRDRSRDAVIDVLTEGFSNRSPILVANDSDGVMTSYRKQNSAVDDDALTVTALQNKAALSTAAAKLWDYYKHHVTSADWRNPRQTALNDDVTRATPGGGGYAEDETAAAAVLDGMLRSLRDQQVYQLRLLQQLQRQIDEFAASAALVHAPRPSPPVAASPSPATAREAPAICSTSASLTLRGTDRSKRELVSPMSAMMEMSYERLNHMTAYSQSPPPPNYTRRPVACQPTRSSSMQTVDRAEHRCRYCQKCFHGDSALQIHIRSHTGERPYRCAICGSCFSTKGNMKVHMAGHSEPSRLRLSSSAAFRDQSVCLSTTSAALIDERAIERPTSSDPMMVKSLNLSNTDVVLTKGSGTELIERPNALTASSPTVTSPTRAGSTGPNTGRANGVVMPSNGVIAPSLHHQTLNSGDNSGSNSSAVALLRPSERGVDKLNSAIVSAPVNAFAPLPWHTPFNVAVPPPPINVYRAPLVPVSACLQRSGTPSCRSDGAMLSSGTPCRSVADPLEQFMDIDEALASSDAAAVAAVTAVNDCTRGGGAARRRTRPLDANQCAVCLRTLSCRSALLMHYRTHTGQRPYSCRLCRRAFTTKGNLKTHMGVHRITPSTLAQVSRPAAMCRPQLDSLHTLRPPSLAQPITPVVLPPAAVLPPYNLLSTSYLPFTALPLSSTLLHFPLLRAPYVDHGNAQICDGGGRRPTSRSTSPVCHSGADSGCPTSSTATGGADADADDDDNDDADGADDDDDEMVDVESSEDSAVAPTTSSETDPAGGGQVMSETDRTWQRQDECPLRLMERIVERAESRGGEERPVLVVDGGSGENRSPAADGGQAVDMSTAAPPATHFHHALSISKTAPNDGSRSEPFDSPITPTYRRLSSTNRTSPTSDGVADRSGITAARDYVGDQPSGAISGSAVSQTTFASPPRLQSVDTSTSCSTLSCPRRGGGVVGVLSRHACHVCAKPFSSASALQIHTRTHTGDRPFRCPVCRKAFTTKGNLKVHVGTHSWTHRPSLRRGRRVEAMRRPDDRPWRPPLPVPALLPPPPVLMRPVEWRPGPGQMFAPLTLQRRCFPVPFNLGPSSATDFIGHQPTGALASERTLAMTTSRLPVPVNVVGTSLSGASYSGRADNDGVEVELDLRVSSSSATLPSRC